MIFLYQLAYVFFFLGFRALTLLLLYIVFVLPSFFLVFCCYIFVLFSCFVCLCAGFIVGTCAIKPARYSLHHELD
jgi:hypothetical protein